MKNYFPVFRRFFMFRIFTAVFLLLLAAGCSTRHTTVVLTQDPDGKIGKAVVQNQAGSRELSSPGEAVEVKGAEKEPGAVFVMEPEQIDKTFGPAISAQPLLPATFLLYFNGGTTELTPSSSALLEKIPTEVEKRGHCQISVVGHSDRVGSEEYNLKLSLKRAEAVKEHLIERGMASQDIRVDSHGESNPLIPTEDDVEEPKNRRVEVTIR